MFSAKNAVQCPSEGEFFFKKKIIYLLAYFSSSGLGQGQLKSCLFYFNFIILSFQHNILQKPDLVNVIKYEGKTIPAEARGAFYHPVQKVEND